MTKDKVQQAWRQMNLVLSGKVFLLFGKPMTQAERDQAVQEFKDQAVARYDKALAMFNETQEA